MKSKEHKMENIILITNEKANNKNTFIFLFFSLVELNYLILVY